MVVEGGWCVCVGGGGGEVTASSIEHGGTRPFSNIMAPLTLFNKAPKRKSVAPLALKNAYLWFRGPL